MKIRTIILVIFCVVFLALSCLFFTLARKILRDEHLANDACQLTFISIAQNLYKLPENPGEIRTYISKIARNVALDIYRKYSKI